MKNKMTYQAFQETILEDVAQELNQQGNYKCEIMQVQKNNGARTGLSICQNGSNRAPVLYLDGYYESYIQGESLQHIKQKMIAIYKTSEIPYLNEFNLGDYTKIKEKLRIRLVDKAAKNQEFYKMGPYKKELLGVAILYMDLVRNEEGTMSTHVTNTIAKEWGIPEAELFATALENTQDHQKISLSPIEDMIGEIVGGVQPAKSPAIYVLTNEQREYGATVTLYPESLKQVREQMGDDYYIIPSSIHEGATRFAA